MVKAYLRNLATYLFYEKFLYLALLNVIHLWFYFCHWTSFFSVKVCIFGLCEYNTFMILFLSLNLFLPLRPNKLNTLYCVWQQLQNICKFNWLFGIWQKCGCPVATRSVMTTTYCCHWCPLGYLLWNIQISQKLTGHYMTLSWSVFLFFQYLQSVNNLTVETRKIVKGNHSRKTAAFVRVSL